MNLRELRLLQSSSPLVADVITAQDLANREPRTLVYGRATDRLFLHVYLGPDGAIHRVIYDASGMRVSHTPEERITANGEYAPARTLHPEACDYEFCLKLRQHGVELPFTRWDDSRDATGAFHGLVDAQLAAPEPLAFRVA